MLVILLVILHVEIIIELHKIGNIVVRERQRVVELGRGVEKRRRWVGGGHVARKSREAEAVVRTRRILYWVCKASVGVVCEPILDLLCIPSIGRVRDEEEDS